MARSSAIWVVRTNKEILGTFTVKHEMINAVARCGIPLDLTIIERMPDGRLCQPGVFDDTKVKELIQEHREWYHVDDFIEAHELKEEK